MAYSELSQISKMVNKNPLTIFTQIFILDVGLASELRSVLWILVSTHNGVVELKPKIL